MDEVITLSSNSDDSDVEIVGSFTTTKDEPQPLTAVRIDVKAVNVNVPPVSKSTVTVETCVLRCVLKISLLLQLT